MKSFIDNKFIFSDERKYRLKRHLLFWAFWGFYFGMVRELNPRFYVENGHFPNLFKSMAEAFTMLLPQAVLVYPLLYFILPRYVFNGKYVKATLWIIVLLMFTVLINAVFIINIPWQKAIWLPARYRLFSPAGSFLGKLSMAYLSALQGSLTGAALASSFKMFKYYYVKNIRNQQLQKENAESQLQLLKAQVHPHFLFNTLNNIYSQVQTESPKGAKMLMGLSDMLRYILYEGQKPLVRLEKELSLITEYINLEKIRYGNKLEVHLLKPDKTKDILIAPLLLLPFVENCFKHGASNMLHHPWINLNVELNDTILVMKLVNGKIASKDDARENGGIGIQNVRKRLELLYTDKYDLQIREDVEVFIVDLKVELVRIKSKPEIKPTEYSQANASYA